MSAYSSYKRWLLLLLPAFACLLCIAGIVNYTVDLYGFFRKDLTKQLVEPNQNFLKVRYITGSAVPFDSFIFGSSRVANILVQNIDNGGRWYNMTYSGGLPQEHLMNIEYMVKKGMKIKELLIGLDEFSFQINPDDHARLWTTKLYSPVQGESEVLFYLRYIFHFPDIKVLQTAYKEYQARKRPQNREKKTIFSEYDFYGNGQLTFRAMDDQINQNPEKHRTDSKFLKPYKSYNDETDNSATALASLKRIVDLARTNGIKLTIFINPIHKVTYLSTNHERFFSFKRRLSSICAYYDFSGLNAVTQDNLNYYETSHYRPIIGDRILRSIFAANGSDSGFGELVTADSVERHIARQREEIGQ